MSEQSRKNQSDTSDANKGPSVDVLATTALSLVAKRTAKAAHNFDPILAERLRDAAAEDASNPVPELIQEMLTAGVTAESVACLYIPHAARQMGEDWCDDTLSFARVTIGTARLQSSLRTLGADWTSHGYSEDPNSDNHALIIVARDPFHTLGAMVLCGQLRRLGLSVRLALGATSQDLRAIFATTEFDTVLISASSSESLASLRECVDIIRQSASVRPPIVVGGNVLDQEADVKSVTGADFTTKDPYEALELCGIEIQARAETHNQDGGLRP